MTRSLVWRNMMPFLSSDAWDDDFDWGLATNQPNGLSLSEDDDYVYVTAHLPGVDPDEIELTFDKGVLWIKGESKTEEKDKKYYRKASNSFSYRVNVPGEIDLEKEPEADCENGVCEVRFAKKPQSRPKKISVRKKGK